MFIILYAVTDRRYSFSPSRVDYITFRIMMIFFPLIIMSFCCSRFCHNRSVPAVYLHNVQTPTYAHYILHIIIIIPAVAAVYLLIPFTSSFLPAYNVYILYCTYPVAARAPLPPPFHHSYIITWLLPIIFARKTFNIIILIIPNTWCYATAAATASQRRLPYVCSLSVCVCVCVCVYIVNRRTHHKPLKTTNGTNWAVKHNPHECGWFFFNRRSRDAFQQTRIERTIGTYTILILFLSTRRFLCFRLFIIENHLTPLGCICHHS